MLLRSCNSPDGRKKIVIIGSSFSFLDQRKKLGLSDFEAGMGAMFLANLQRIEKNGKMTPLERKQVVLVCKQLISMLQGKR